MLNINGNQNGTQIPNNVIFNFTNASGTNQTLTGVGPTLNTIVPHLSITKTANPTTVEGGQIITFTVKVLNNNDNGAPAYNVQVLDPLVGYDNLSNIIITPSDGTIIYSNNSTSNLLDININQLNQTQYLNITYQATVNSNVTYGQQVNNTAQVTGTSLPGDHGTNNATPGNPGSNNGKRTGDPTQPAGVVNNLIDTSTATVTVRSPTISKNVEGQKTINRTIDDTATENLIITLPVGTTNDFSITDIAPSGLQLSGFNYTTSMGIVVNQFKVTSIGNTYTFDFGNITASQEGNITINYNVQVLDIAGNINGQNLTNNATLFYQNIIGQNVNSGSDTANIKVIEPNLLITKTASKTNLVVGEQFTYTLLIKHSNSSTADANNIIITDDLPSGMSYVVNSVVLPPTWALTVIGNTLTFSSPLLTLSNNNVTISFNFTVNNDIALAGQNLTNTANMNYTSLSSGGRDYGPVSSSSQVHIQGADLSVIKTGNSNVHAGQAVSYTITVTNLGPDTAYNVTFTDTFSTPWFNLLINPEYSLNGGPFTTISGNPWTLSLGDILSGNNDIIQINAIISPSAQAGIINNIANATSYTTDPNPNNNNYTKLTNVDTLADLNINKTAATTVDAGNKLVYTVVVSNSGPSDAQDVVVNDNVPVLSNVTWSLNGVNMGGWTDTANLGVMKPGEVDTLLFTGTVPSGTVNGTVLNNTAYVTSPTDPDSHNSTAITNVSTLANLSITKTAASTVVAGNSLVYTVVVSNSGPSDAQDVVVNDVVPVLSDVIWSLNGVNMGVWSGTANLGVMVPGQIDTLLFSGIVPSGTANGTVLNNTAYVNSPTDPDSHNSTAITNLTTLTNLTIIKTGNATVLPGGIINYKIFIKNNGPSDALDVHLYDDINPSVTDAQYSLSGTTGTWSPWPPASGYLDLGTLIAGQNETIFIMGIVNQSANQDITNTAIVTSSNSQDMNSTVVTHLKTADIGITKYASTTKPNYLDNVTFTIKAHNYGPDQATGVQVTDILPNGLKYISASVTQGTYNSTSGVWTIGNINNGSTVLLTIIAQIEKTGNITNTANKTEENEYDPNPNNNQDSVTLNVQEAADLSITKTVKPTNPSLHDTAIFTIIVHNHGPTRH